jgi:hypothetical protein
MKEYKSDGSNIINGKIEFGEWVLKEDSIVFIKSNVAAGLFANGGLVGGLIGSIVANPHETAKVLYSDIKSVEFKKFRLNSKTLYCSTISGNDIQMVVNRPNEWINIIKERISRQ